MPTLISDLWIPDIWTLGVSEKAALLPSLITSPIVQRTTEFDDIATGGGIAAEIPYFHDITDQNDVIAVENTQPTLQKITSGKQIAPILNREYAVSCTALAAAVAQVPYGTPMTPIEAMTSQLAIGRQKRRQAVLISILRGIFGFSSTPGGSGVLSSVRNDLFLEAGASPATSQVIGSNTTIDTIALLGELADEKVKGGILMHSTIRAALIKQDQISFIKYSLQDGTTIETYRGYRVFCSDLLVRNGASTGKVYDTYIFNPGVFAWGEKPQVGQAVDVASLSYWLDNQKGNEEIYDRSRFLIHPIGLKWTGTPAGQSAANSELATLTNWALDYQTAARVGIVCIRSNG